MKRFPDNSNICFVGDSITHINRYLMHIVSYYKNNFSEANINFYNCGISGGVLSEHLKTIYEDVLSYEPTHIVLLIGINDSNRSLLKEKRSIIRYEKLKNSFENYKKNLKTICDIFRKKGINITLCTCIPYDEYGEYCVNSLKGGTALIMSYNEYIRSFAKENNFTLCDYYPYILEKMQNETLYGNDGVHPTDKGHFYIAQCFLKNQGIDLNAPIEFSQKLVEWDKNVKKLRDMYTVEMMVLKDYNLSFEEASLFLNDYLRNDSKNLACREEVKNYLINRPNKIEIKERIINLMKEL